MKHIFLILFFGCLALGCKAHEQARNNSHPALTYELYSWRGSDGVWSFSILLPTERVKTPEEIFNEKDTVHGLDKLKAWISHLGPRSRIVWMENLAYPDGRRLEGTERLERPSKETIEDVRRYAATKHVDVVWPK